MLCLHKQTLGLSRFCIQGILDKSVDTLINPTKILPVCFVLMFPIFIGLKTDTTVNWSLTAVHSLYHAELMTC